MSDDIETLRRHMLRSCIVEGPNADNRCIAAFILLEAIEARLHAAEEERDIARKTAAKAVKDMRRALAELDRLRRNEGIFIGALLLMNDGELRIPNRLLVTAEGTFERFEDRVTDEVVFRGPTALTSSTQEEQ